LSAEVIKNIRQTEQQAEEIRQDAMLKAREIIESAEKQGVDILEDSAKDAAEEGKQLIAKKRSEAMQEIERLKVESEERSIQLAAQARAQKDRASSFIMERIVKFYGDN